MSAVVGVRFAEMHPEAQEWLAAHPHFHPRFTATSGIVAEPDRALVRADQQLGHQPRQLRQLQASGAGDYSPACPLERQRKPFRRSKTVGQVKRDIRDAEPTYGTEHQQRCRSERGLPRAGIQVNRVTSSLGTLEQIPSDKLSLEPCWENSPCRLLDGMDIIRRPARALIRLGRQRILGVRDSATITLSLAHRPA